jgi:hypothetical protein
MDFISAAMVRLHRDTLVITGKVNIADVAKAGLLTADLNTTVTNVVDLRVDDHTDPGPIATDLGDLERTMTAAPKRKTKTTLRSRKRARSRTIRLLLLYEGQPNVFVIGGGSTTN